MIDLGGAAVSGRKGNVTDQVVGLPVQQAFRELEGSPAKPTSELRRKENARDDNERDRVPQYVEDGLESGRKIHLVIIPSQQLLLCLAVLW